MAQVRITPRHREMLIALADSYRDQKMGVDWILMTSGGGTAIACLDLSTYNPTQLPGWKNVNPADFVVFSKLGICEATRLDRDGDPDRYTIFEADLLDLVDHNFEVPDAQSPVTFHVSGSGSIINVQSTLNNSTQTIHNSPALADEDKIQFEALIEKLESALGQVPDEYGDDKEAVAVCASRLAEDVSRSKPNKKAIAISAEGLKKAAENIAGIAAPVLATVNAILSFVARLHS